MPRIVLQPDQVAQLEEAIRIADAQQDEFLAERVYELRVALEDRDPAAAFESSDSRFALNAALVAEVAVYVESPGSRSESDISPRSLQDCLDLGLGMVETQRELAEIVKQNPFAQLSGLGRFGATAPAANRASLFAEPALRARVTALLSVYLQDELDAYLTARGFGESIRAWQLYMARSGASRALSGLHFLAIARNEEDRSLLEVLPGFIGHLERPESPLWAVIGGLNGKDPAQSRDVLPERGTGNIVFFLGDKPLISVPAPFPLDELARIDGGDSDDVSVSLTTAQARLLGAVLNIATAEVPPAYPVADPGSPQWELKVLAAELGVGLDLPMGVEAQSPRDPAPFPWARVQELLGVQDLFSRIYRAVAATPATDFVTVRGREGLELVLTNEALLAMEAAANRPATGSSLREVWDLQIAARQLAQSAPYINRSQEAARDFSGSLVRLIARSGETEIGFLSRVLEERPLNEDGTLATSPTILYVNGVPLVLSAQVTVKIHSMLIGRHYGNFSSFVSGLSAEARWVLLQSFEMYPEPEQMARRVKVIQAVMQGDDCERLRAQHDLRQEVAALNRDIEVLAGRSAAEGKEPLVVQSFITRFQRLATAWNTWGYLSIWNTLMEGMDPANPYAALIFNAPDETAYFFSPRLPGMIVEVIEVITSERWEKSKSEFLSGFSPRAKENLAPYLAARHAELSGETEIDADIAERIERLEEFAEAIGHPIESIGLSESEIESAPPTDPREALVQDFAEWLRETGEALFDPKWYAAMAAWEAYRARPDFSDADLSLAEYLLALEAKQGPLFPPATVGEFQRRLAEAKRLFEGRMLINLTLGQVLLGDDRRPVAIPTAWQAYMATHRPGKENPVPSAAQTQLAQAIAGRETSNRPGADLWGAALATARFALDFERAQRSDTAISDLAWTRLGNALGLPNRDAVFAALDQAVIELRGEDSLILPNSERSAAVHLPLAFIPYFAVHGLSPHLQDSARWKLVAAKVRFQMAAQERFRLSGRNPSAPQAIFEFGEALGVESSRGDVNFLSRLLEGSMLDYYDREMPRQLILEVEVQDVAGNRVDLSMSQGVVANYILNLFFDGYFTAIDRAGYVSRFSPEARWVVRGAVENIASHGGRSAFNPLFTREDRAEIDRLIRASLTAEQCAALIARRRAHHLAAAVGHLLAIPERDREDIALLERQFETLADVLRLEGGADALYLQILEAGAQSGFARDFSVSVAGDFPPLYFSDREIVFIAMHYTALGERGVRTLLPRLKQALIRALQWMLGLEKDSGRQSAEFMDGGASTPPAREHNSFLESLRAALTWLGASPIAPQTPSPRAESTVSGSEAGRGADAVASPSGSGDRGGSNGPEARDRSVQEPAIAEWPLGFVYMEEGSALRAIPLLPPWSSLAEGATHMVSAQPPANNTAAYRPRYDWHSDAHERYAAFCAFSQDSGQPIPNALTAEALAAQLEVRASELRLDDVSALDLLRDTSGDAQEQIARWTTAFAELMGPPSPGRGGANAGRPLPTNVLQFTPRGAPSGSFSPVH